MEEQIFNADENSLFYKDAGKWTYTVHVAFWLRKIWPEAHKNLTTYFP